MDAVLLILIVLFYLLSPLVALGFTISYLCFFISARRKNKRCPGTVPQSVVDWYKKSLIIGSICTVVLAGVCWTTVILFAMSLRFM